MTGLNQPTVAGLSVSAVTMTVTCRDTRPDSVRRSTAVTIRCGATPPLRRTARTCFIAHTSRMDASTDPASQTGAIQPYSETRRPVAGSDRSVQILVPLAMTTGRADGGAPCAAGGTLASAAPASTSTNVTSGNSTIAASAAHEMT